MADSPNKAATPHHNGDTDSLDISLADLSRTLAKLRKERGFSLATVAQGTDLSVSFLSLVEAGKSDISFGRLLRLVAFYGLTLSDLLPPKSRSVAQVVRVAQRRHVFSPAEHIHMYLLAPDTRRTMMPVITIYEPHAETAEFTSHSGEEFILILEGQIILTFADAEPLVLEEGDSVYFDSSIPHHLTNSGSMRTVLTATITPPTW